MTASENCRREDKLQIISHTPLASYPINYFFIIDFLNYSLVWLAKFFLS